ncbi:unnamed protein product [Peniophora sp. CBMAI 1063]|nr:unnamed protein product [Peniophora sp. CBMAI 1063]
MDAVNYWFAGTSLDWVIIIALVLVPAGCRWSALNGASWIADTLVLAPGLLAPQDACAAKRGELPVAGAMHSGLVSRIENPAMVSWLYQISRPGHLVEALVETVGSETPYTTLTYGTTQAVAFRRIRLAVKEFLPLSFIPYVTGILCTITSFVFLSFIGDYWAMGVLSILVVAKGVNVVTSRRRFIRDGGGRSSPRVSGDLLVLLNPNRWVRLRGDEDDLDFITSRQSVREPTYVESLALGGATLSVYAAAILARKSTTVGNLVIASLLSISAALLRLYNAASRCLYILNRKVSRHGSAKRYERLLDLAEEMIDIHGGRRDWAIEMGLVLSQPEPSAPRPPFTLFSMSSKNTIRKQREHSGRYCIPAALADRQIKDPAMLLAILNDIFGTHYSLQVFPELEAVLLSFIGACYDFGMIYGLLRPRWFCTSELGSVVSLLEQLKHEDTRRRKPSDRARKTGLILTPTLAPRRVWDLYSNRILPSWATKLVYSDIIAVSHAWLSPSARSETSTAINHYEWPVALPRELSLDDLRIELLNLGCKESGNLEYAWLDVLCLRQQSGKPLTSDELAQEWTIDVPAIGAIYRNCKSVVVYMNGLGLPFQTSDLSDPSHWCNRVETLQTLRLRDSGMLLGGRTDGSPSFDFSSLNRVVTKEPFVQQLGFRILTGEANMRHIISAVAEMKSRSAREDIDKIAGLIYPFCATIHPALYQAPEFFESRRFFGLYVGVGELAAPMFHAVFKAIRSVVPGAQEIYHAAIISSVWRRFIYCVTASTRADLFYLFPAAGDGHFKWTPSWSQLFDRAESLMKYGSYALQLPDEYSPFLLDMKPPARHELAMSSKPRQYGDHDEEYFCRAVRVRDCRVSGFACAAPPAEIRRGTITFSAKRPDGTIDTMIVNMVARHSIPIPNGAYCALANLANGANACRYWVVGYLNGGLIDTRPRFTKISVLEVDNDFGGEWTSMRLGENLGALRWDAAHGEYKGQKTSRWVKSVRLA